MYNKKIIENFVNPKNAGKITKPEGRADYSDDICHNTVKVFLRIKKGIITDAKFKASGGPVTIASSSVLMQMIINKTVEEVKNISYEFLLVEMGAMPPEKFDCALTGLKATYEAIKKYERKQKK
jgi:NifU-like protein involved in Fe-S cluster formation